MLDLARLEPGHHVLDVAAGAGEPAVSAAERVGPSGHVLATDLSEGIVALAAEVARERGLEQVETRAMDGEKLELPDASFDATTTSATWLRVWSATCRMAAAFCSSAAVAAAPTCAIVPTCASKSMAGRLNGGNSTSRTSPGWCTGRATN